ncbi:MAG: HlyD family secretion protein, partial [Gammaproteobacteria bacterium]|nr:HlyD family secretion protein [Gammaproteobacteria bacterium]
LLVLLLAAAVLGAMEVHERLTHVSETDARVDAKLVTVSSRVSGWVDKVAVEEGDRIDESQILVSVDDRESRLRVQQLEVQLRSVESEKARLRAERELIDKQTSSHYETELKRLNAAQASVSALEAQLELAQSELARAQSLFEKKVATRQGLEQARAESRRIEGEHRMALAEVEESVARLEEARAERARLLVLERSLEMLDHRRDELLVSLEQEKVDLADHSIRAPVTGVVDRVFVEAGEFVTPGQRLTIVHDPRSVWVEANIKETEIRKLALGQAVEVHVDAFPDEEFTGEVINIGHATTGSFALLPAPNPSGNFTKITQRLPVRIAIEQRDGKLRPGMMVEIKIDVRPR